MKKLLPILLLCVFSVVGFARQQSSYTVQNTTSGVFQVYKGTYVFTDTLDAFPSSATYNNKVVIDGMNGRITATHYGDGSHLTGVILSGIDADCRASTGTIYTQLQSTGAALSVETTNRQNGDSAIGVSTAAIYSALQSTGSALSTETNNRITDDYNIGLATQTEYAMRTSGIWVNEGVRVGTATISNTASNYTGTISSTNTLITNISGSLNSLKDYMNNVQSSGRLTGGVLSSNSPENGTIIISTMTGMIKRTNTVDAELSYFSINTATGIALTDNDLNYIYLDYNGGTPIYRATTDRTTIHDYDNFTVGRVYRSGNETDVVNSGTNIFNFYRRIHNRLVKKYGFDRASGSMLAETGQRKLTLTAGVWYIDNTEIATAARDTSASDTFSIYWRNGSGGWNVATGSTTLSNLLYDNNSGTLATLANNKYAVYWVFQCSEGSIYVVYGQNDYTLSQAQSTTSPATLPDYVSKNTKLVGRVIILKNATNILEIASAFQQTFAASSAVNHNELGGLQGGATGEYYHLNASTYAVLTSWAGGIPATNILAGPLASNVITSSTAVNSVYPLACQTGTYSNITLPSANIASGPLGSSVIATSITVSAVGIPQINANGTPSASTYLNGNGTWATPAGSGDAVLAGTQTWSGTNTFLQLLNTNGGIYQVIYSSTVGVGVSSMTVNISAYNGLKIEWYMVGASLGGYDARIQLNGDNTNGHYVRRYWGDNYTSGNENRTAIRIGAPSVGDGVLAKIDIPFSNTTSLGKGILQEDIQNFSGGNPVIQKDYFYFTGTAAITQITFYVDTAGTMAGSQIRILGLK